MPDRVDRVISRREVALRLDIPIEMAVRHNIGAKISEASFEALEANPPAWLLQSRANRTGKKPVWVKLDCVVCGYSETSRPKKWWPKFTYLACDHHEDSEVPSAASGTIRCDYEGVGGRFRGFVDEPVETTPAE